jgi:FkbM family methyltransferase
MQKAFEIKQTQFGNFLINEFDLIGNCIFQTGMWEPHLYNFYSLILEPNDICIDAGANLGFHTIQFGKLSKKVYAFEPQLMVYNQLCSNILFNDLNEIIIPYRLALGDKKETKQMWDIKNENFGNNIYNWGGRGIEHSQSAYNSNEIREHDQVEIINLDSLKLNQCNLIKIDIQGYEYYAFLGAENLIKTHTPTLLLENGSTEIDKKVIDLLKTWGYENYRYYLNNNEDCILIHPQNEKYDKNLNIINQIKNKYNIKKDF